MLRNGEVDAVAYDEPALQAIRKSDLHFQSFAIGASYKDFDMVAVTASKFIKIKKPHSIPPAFSYNSRALRVGGATASGPQCYLNKPPDTGSAACVLLTEPCPYILSR